MSAYGLTPLVLAWGVGRGAGEQWPDGRWGQPGFPGAREWVALPLSALICGPDGAKTPRKGVEKAVFSKSTTWIISAQLLCQHTVKPTVASTWVKIGIDVSYDSVLTCAENLALQTSAGSGKRSIS